MDFTGINKVGTIAEFLPTKKLSELTAQSEYPISDIRAVQTKFGKKFIADVSDEFTVFLPTRLVKVLDEDTVMFEKLLAAAKGGHLNMKYFGGKYNSIEFKRC